MYEKFFLFIFLTALLCGCSDFASQETPLGSITPAQLDMNGITKTSATAALSTAIPRQQAGELTPVTTEGAAQPKNTATSKPAIKSSATSPEQSRQILTNLLAANGNCQLPCQLGLTPGQIDLDGFREFTNQFGEVNLDGDTIIDIHDFDQYGGISFLFWKDAINYQVDLDYWKLDEKIKALLLYASADSEQGEEINRKFIPEYGEESFRKLMKNYLMHQILSDYGAPSKIYLLPFPENPNAPAGYPPIFSIVLFYPEKGFFAEYLFPRKEDGSKYSACPQDIGHISIIGWEPDQEVSIHDVAKYSSGVGIHEVNVGDFKPLEEVTDLTVDDFVKIFSDPKGEDCLDTSQEFWLATTNS